MPDGLLNVRYSSPDGIDLHLDVLGPARPSTRLPVVVRIDGCPGWGPGDRSNALLPFANPALARAGFLTIAISVRHTGQATFPAQLHDVQAALRWIRRNPLGLPIDPDRVGIWGQSAGGHLAALAALHSTDLRAAVTISGPADLLLPGGAMRIDRPSPVTALVGGDATTHHEQLRAASPVTHVTAAAPPFLIIHGTHDETVPYEQAERLHRALLTAGAKSRLLPITGGHHNLQANPQASYNAPIWYDVATEAAHFFRHHLTLA